MRGRRRPSERARDATSESPVVPTRLLAVRAPCGAVAVEDHARLVVVGGIEQAQVGRRRGRPAACGAQRERVALVVGLRGREQALEGLPRRRAIVEQRRGGRGVGRPPPAAVVAAAAEPAEKTVEEAARRERDAVATAAAASTAARRMRRDRARGREARRRGERCDTAAAVPERQGEREQRVREQHHVFAQTHQDTIVECSCFVWCRQWNDMMARATGCSQVVCSQHATAVAAPGS